MEQVSYLSQFLNYQFTIHVIAGDTVLVVKLIGYFGMLMDTFSAVSIYYTSRPLVSKFIYYTECFVGTLLCITEEICAQHSQL